METTITSQTWARKFSIPNKISPAFLGGLVSALLIFSGIIFRTYTISMASGEMEMARQLGLPFFIAELVVILFALRKGFDPGRIWRHLPEYIRWSATSFVAIFWIGSAFFSPIMLASIAHNMIFLIHIMFAVAIYDVIGRFDFKDLECFGRHLSTGLLIFCAMTAYALIFHPSFHIMPNNEIIWQFAIPGFISLRLFGAFCGAIFCFILGILLIAEEEKSLRFWHFLWLTLAAGMMIWSGTRAAVVGSIVAFTCIAAIYRLRPSFRASLGIVISLIASAILATVLIPYNDPTFMLIAAGDGASAEAASGGRLSYWAAIWEGYLQIPIFGAGPFASHFIVEKGQQIHVQPHNIILQFLTTWGIVATLLALFLMTVATWHAHKIARDYRVVLPLLLMLDCLLVMSFFDGMMHFAQHLMLIMICFGMIFGYRKSQADIPGRIDAV